jgi:hypothetical protein
VFTAAMTTTLIHRPPMNQSSLEMGHTSATCGRGTARRDSAFQQPDSSKEWMFEGNVAVPNLSEVDLDDNDGVPDEVREGFPEVGEELKASFSINAPAEIEYIVTVSDIEKVSCEVYQNEKMLGVPVRGYVATSRRVHRKEWEDLIRWCSAELEHLTWTKISGGIRCWDQFKYDRDDVNDPESTVGVLAMWGTRSYFDARGSAWEFHGTLALPSRADGHSDVLQMATEAFYAAAGLPKEWPRSIILSRSRAVLSVHTIPLVFKCFWRYAILPLAFSVESRCCNPPGLQLTVRLWSSTTSP